MAVALLASDVDALRGGEWNVSHWIADAGRAFLARLLMRPALLAVIRPGLLTDTLKGNRILGRPGGPPYDAFRQNFIPFECSRAQFYFYLSVARHASSLYRSLYLVTQQHAEHRFRCPRALAFDLGDRCADMLELGMVASRYGISDRTGASLQLAKIALALRCLALNRSLDVGAALTAACMWSIGPQWWFVYTGQKRNARIAAILNAIGSLLAGSIFVRRLWSSLAARKMERTYVETDRYEQNVGNLLLAVFSLISVYGAYRGTRFFIKTK